MIASIMTFDAYIGNIHAKTGKAPVDFVNPAVAQGVLRPETRATEFVNWLKASSGLGHGHAMAIWEAFRRKRWILLTENLADLSPVRRAGPTRPRREAKP